MNTISADQFKSKYGDQALKQFSAPAQATQQGFIQKNILNPIGDSFTGGLKNSLQAVKDIGGDIVAGNAPKSILDTTRAGAGLAQSIGSPLAPVINPTIGAGVNAVANGYTGANGQHVGGISDFPAVQKFSNSRAGGITSGIVEGIGNTAAIAGTAAGVKGTLKGLSNLAESFGKNISDNAKGNVLPPGGAASNAVNSLTDRVTDQKISPQVKTMLPDSPVEKFDRYVKAGQEAISDPRKLTPLEHAGNTAVKIAQVIKEDLGNIGRQKAATLESVKDLKLPDIAVRQIERLKPVLQQKLTGAERGLVNSLMEELQSLGKTPTAGSVDATIDRLQSTLFEKSKGVAVPATPRIKAFVNSTIKALNDELKGSVDKNLGSNDYSMLNSEYSTRSRMFQALNKALGEDGNKGGSLLKRFFSPQDSGTKNLFAAIKEKYGVDLGQDATIAKFVMDTLGDTRAKSLLQLPPTTPVSAIQKGLEYAEGKLTSPDRVFKSARSMTRKQTSP